jgi:hypothetical protein
VFRQFIAFLEVITSSYHLYHAIYEAFLTKKSSSAYSSN